MTPNKRPTLRINRLVIFAKGKAVFNESFHKGVNIIRGKNSSGKSTIADFLFFALGGDFTKWKPEAEQCDFVCAELNISDVVITVRRKVQKARMQAMEIYWGDYEKASKSIEGWQVFSFQKSANKNSFSQVLFNIFGFPEVRGDTDNNITIHQLLRLIYVDQLSKIEVILREEPFDLPITRRTIADLLFGLYDETIYREEIELREAEKSLDEVKIQLKGLLEVLKEVEQEEDLAVIEGEISEKKNLLTEIQSKIVQYDSTKNIEKNDVVLEQIENARKQYLESQEILNGLKNRTLQLEMDIDDSKRFVQSLEARIKSLDESSVIRTTLDSIKLTYCPLCLEPLEENDIRDVCRLCKQKISTESHKTKISRFKQELIFQIKESNSILSGKEEELSKLKRQIPQTSEEVQMAKERLNDELKKVRTKRDKELDGLLEQKGILENTIIFLHKQAKASVVLEGLKKKQSDLQHKIMDLRLAIKNKRGTNEKRQIETFEKIESIAKVILKLDLRLEESFMNPDKVSIDFEKNTFAVNDRNQFSASSIVYLKNCIHYAIFFASLELEYFRYPRFIICDNMEDKGMQPERSQNFQKQIVEMAKKYEGDFQIIFTTSMIAPELNDTPLCVGRFYTQEKKSLDFG